MEDAEVLASALRAVERGLMLVVTGAGVSAPSGLATFRGSDRGAIWRRDVTEIGTRAFFERDPVAWWRTALVPREALGWRVPVLSIDPEPAPLPAGVSALRSPAERLLPETCRRLGIALPD